MNRVAGASVTLPSPMPSRSRAVLDELELLLAQVPTEDLPDLLGHLERLRLGGTLRLVAGLRATPLPPPPAVDPTTLLTVAEVAGRLKITSWSVYDLVRRDRLPGVRLGRALRVRQVDLEAYVHGRPVDDGAYTMYASRDDGSHAPAAAAVPRGEPARPRRRAPGHGKHRGPVGAG
jgi:excisionase family DNA binding protein